MRKGTTLKSKAERMMRCINSRWPGHALPLDCKLYFKILINPDAGKVDLDSGRDFRALFKKEHSLAQRHEIVRRQDHRIEWRGPQMNQVEGAKTLVLGEAADSPAR